MTLDKLGYKKSESPKDNELLYINENERISIWINLETKSVYIQNDEELKPINEISIDLLKAINEIL